MHSLGPANRSWSGKSDVTGSMAGVQLSKVVVTRIACSMVEAVGQRDESD